MRIFISAGEPSGDIHGASLIRSLKQRRPDLEFVGFGGERIAAEGATLLYPLVDLAVMFITRVLAHIATFYRILRQADRYFAEHRPDAVVLIDYPGFHWWLAKKAKARGIPVYYFVPPQLWAWAGWRVKKMKRTVDHVLCTLPFEKDWYEQRGVVAEYIGHPFFDDLAHQRFDADFLAEQRAKGGEIVALLPGSRNQEVERNLESMIRAAELILAKRPGVRFLVASFKPNQRAMVDAHLAKHPGLPIETYLGRTPEIMELCKVCLAVSGSVSLELLYRKKPTVIIYRVSRVLMAGSKYVVKVPYICLVNLLAKREVFPEFLSFHCPATAISERLLHWLESQSDHAETVDQLNGLCRQVAVPGACDRAADYLLATLATERRAAA